MSARTDLLSLLGCDGGILLRVEWLDAAGRVAEATADGVVADLALTPHAIAFHWVFGARPHAHAFQSVQRVGDEWILAVTGSSLRLVAGPLWLEAHAGILDRWSTRTERVQLRRELQQLAHAVGRHRSERAPRLRRAPLRFRVRWHARLGRGHLVDLGVLLLSPDNELRFFAHREHQSFETTFNRELGVVLGRSYAAQVFDYFDGNQQTTTWSKPFTIVAPSIEIAAARLLGAARRGATIDVSKASRSRFKGRDGEGRG